MAVHKLQPLTLTVILLVAMPLALAISLRYGSVDVGWAQLWNSLFQPQHLDSIIYDLRLPRALSAFAVGGLLALSGALLQVLLRNPLADPYILGISGGAAVATLSGILIGISGLLLNVAGFIGALLSMLLVFGLVHRQQSWSPTRLLLTGVIIAAGWGAVTTFILAIAPSSSLHGMLFWLMGDLAESGSPHTALVVLTAGFVISWPLGASLNRLARGELSAAALGENPLRLRIQVYLLASLLTASAITAAGSVGFVGLVVPHLLRLLGSTDHRILLPQSVLFGGVFLMLADTASRTIVAPVQLPVGVITAMLGVPMFLYLMGRSGRRDR